MSNNQIIHAWKNKRVSASLGNQRHAVPVNPAGSGAVSLRELETGEFISSPAPACSIFHCE